jgi:hypothetical protein
MLFETKSSTVGDGDLDACREKVGTAENVADTTGRDKILVEKESVVDAG